MKNNRPITVWIAKNQYAALERIAAEQSKARCATVSISELVRQGIAAITKSSKLETSIDKESN